MELLVANLLSAGVPLVVIVVLIVFMSGERGKSDAFKSLVDATVASNEALQQALRDTSERFENGLHAIATEIKADREFHREELTKLAARQTSLEEHVVRIQADVHSIREGVKGS